MKVEFCSKTDFFLADSEGQRHVWADTKGRGYPSLSAFSRLFIAFHVCWSDPGAKENVTSYVQKLLSF